MVTHSYALWSHCISSWSVSTQLSHYNEAPKCCLTPQFGGSDHAFIIYSFIINFSRMSFTKGKLCHVNTFCWHGYWVDSLIKITIKNWCCIVVLLRKSRYLKWNFSRKQLWKVISKCHCSCTVVVPWSPYFFLFFLWTFH